MISKRSYIMYKILSMLNKKSMNDVRLKAIRYYRGVKLEEDYNRHYSYKQEISRLELLFDILDMEDSYENYLNIKKQIRGMNFYVRYRQNLVKRKFNSEKIDKLNELKQSVAR